MELLSKKTSPDELKTKLSIHEQRLTARENELKKKRQIHGRIKTVHSIR